jgi:hypothetical protein
MDVLLWDQTYNSMLLRSEDKIRSFLFTHNFHVFQGLVTTSKLKKSQFKTTLTPEFRTYTSMTLVPPFLSRFRALEVLSILVINLS